MGRPPKDDFSRRSKSLRLRLTPAEHAWIKVIAKEREINMREALWFAFQKDIREIPEDELAELNVKVVDEMKK